MARETLSKVRLLAAPEAGDIVAAGLFQKTVSIWNLTDGSQLSGFETVFDFGGKRLAISNSESACLAASFQFGGLACYEAGDGALRWRRSDLERIQTITISPDGRLAYCCSEDHPCHLISISNGRTLEKFKFARGLYLSSMSLLRIPESGPMALKTKGRWSTISIEKESFGVLDAAFGDGMVAISEAGKNVRLIDLHKGKLIARYRPPEGSHVLHLSWCPKLQMFLGVEWNYRQGGDQELITLPIDSTVPRVVRSLGQPAVTSFVGGGNQILTSSGDLFECETGNLIRTLEFTKLG